MPVDHEETARDHLPHPYGVEFFGPVLRDSHDVLVDGRRVPYLTLHQEGDVWWLTLDNRFGISGTDAEVRKWARFLADAMAIAAGYSSFGTDQRRLNPFNRRVTTLSVEEMRQITDEPEQGR